MKHCDKCNVDINSDLNYCPLCFNEITENTEEKGSKLYSITADKPKEIIKTHTTRKIFAIISIAVALTCGLINYMTHTPFWSGLVMLGIIYLWILVRHTIMSSRSPFEKVVLQVLGVLAILILSNHVSGGGWFMDYVLPSLLIFVIAVLNMILFVSKKRRVYESSFLIIQLLIIIASVIFMCICDFNLLHLITLCITGLAVVGLVIMDGKNIFKELSKKFHL